MKQLLKKLMLVFLKLTLVDSYVVEGFEIRVFYFKGLLTWRRWTVAERIDYKPEEREQFLANYRKKGKLVRAIEFSSGKEFDEYLREQHPILPDPKRWRDFKIDFKFYYTPAEWPPPKFIWY